MVLMVNGGISTDDAETNAASAKSALCDFREFRAG
jgi:hypothetical protein